MDIRSRIACTSSDLARWGLRSVFKRQGGVLPGRIALKIQPGLLGSLAPLVSKSVVVTGTNGKTTTTNLIADALAALPGTTVVCNRAGNNMEPGIAGAMLESRTALKRADAHDRIGVFECDELYTVRVLPKLKPDFFVLLNLFRDQLDRYGEIDHTQDVIVEALKASPATVLIFNADDPLCASIADRVPNRRIPFGIDGKTGTETDRISDSRFCAKCNAPLDYAYVQYGQLGAYSCPACGWSRPELACRAANVELSCGGYAFDLVTGDDVPARVETTRLSTKYNGLYMVYNVAAAFFAATQMGSDASSFQAALDTYVPAGGRMESWHVAGREVVSNLAKNPVGFDRQIQSIKTAGGRLCAFFLNDNDADGHDVSWIYDVDFERLADTPGLVAFAGGTRAHDMQVRLKYAGIDSTIIDGIAPALGALAGEAADEALFAVANYTAFPPLVQELKGLAEKGLPANGASVAVADGSGIPMPPATPLPLERPLRIVHLYPDALNLYADGGNVIALERRCTWRGIPAYVDEVKMGDALDLSDADIVMMGGGADRDQLAVSRELLAQREKMSAYVEAGGVVLAICGSYQLLGHSYYMGDDKLEGLGVIDVETVRGEGRMIGNVAVKTELDAEAFVGFENHGGRTLLGAGAVPLGRSVVTGTGNNDNAGHEGTLYRGVIGTYLHGPACPKNPALTDWLIAQALKRRNAPDAQALLPLAPLDDTYEHAAHDAAMKLLP